MLGGKQAPTGAASPERGAAVIGIRARPSGSHAMAREPIPSRTISGVRRWMQFPRRRHIASFSALFTPGTMPATQPARLAHFDHRDQCAVLFQDDTGLAQVVRGLHWGAPSVHISDDASGGAGLLAQLWHPISKGATIRGQMADARTRRASRGISVNQDGRRPYALTENLTSGSRCARAGVDHLVPENPAEGSACSAAFEKGPAGAGPSQLAVNPRMGNAVRIS